MKQVSARVEKTMHYTVMLNHHLRNPSLNLKAEGAFSHILPFPEEWNYTFKGLSLTNWEGIDAILEAVKELKLACHMTCSGVKTIGMVYMKHNITDIATLVRIFFYEFGGSNLIELYKLKM